MVSTTTVLTITICYTVAIKMLVNNNGPGQ